DSTAPQLAPVPAPSWAALGTATVPGALTPPPGAPGAPAEALAAAGADSAVAPASAPDPLLSAVPTGLGARGPPPAGSVLIIAAAGRNSAIFYVPATGAPVQIDSTTSADGTVSAGLPHFSVYLPTDTSTLSGAATITLTDAQTRTIGITTDGTNLTITIDGAD